MLHPSSDFLTDITALFEINSVQTFKPIFQYITISGEFDGNGGDASGNPNGGPIAAIVALAFAVKPPAQ